MHAPGYDERRVISELRDRWLNPPEPLLSEDEMENLPEGVTPEEYIEGCRIEAEERKFDEMKEEGLI